MNTRVWRTAHRYLGIIIGVQLLVWTTSGLIFSWNHITSVRGENRMRAAPTNDFQKHSLRTTDEILNLVSSIQDDVQIDEVALRMLLDQPVYEVRCNADSAPLSILFDATTAEVISPISASIAGRVAVADFSEDVAIGRVSLVESVGGHSEYREKELPAFRVELEHATGTVIYVSANSGLVTARRNNQWRLFDFFWMLHTMDYVGRDNFNHWLLRGLSIFGVVTVLSGFGLGLATSRWFRRSVGRRKLLNS